ncbi:hypothetical protein GQ55_8G033900 [Panicum hallii var. hallii]|uniref:Thioredoxin domain-containing protein n=3 Tax=Panicum hallii TaxID=206008 RepID=A0A2T7CK97_9POAL|nr:hypothetical protein PAHAL_8G035300 [Panicum hallii]PUZ43767.1 hypothetical protein GQ55_8G033900 [Panicum hallii var. hallii]
MFWADWNEPCKVMLKSYRDMARAKKDRAVFCRLDVDKFKDVAGRYRVEALPTFVLMKNREEQRRVVGPKVDELNTTIRNSI